MVIISKTTIFKRNKKTLHIDIQIIQIHTYMELIFSCHLEFFLHFTTTISLNSAEFKNPLTEKATKI